MNAKNKQAVGYSSRPGAPLLRALPDEVIEHTGTYSEGFPHNGSGGIVGLKDGTLMIAYPDHLGLKRGDPIHSEYRISSDDGKTWGDIKPLNCEMEIFGIIRLQSGKLLAHGGKRLGDHPTYVSSSSDDGKTWTEPKDMEAYQDFYPYLGAMTQLSSGRIILAGYWEGLNAGRPDQGFHG